MAYHVIGSSDPVDVWVIKIKKPMILCASSTSRSREQSTKRRSHSENVQCVWLSNMADTFFWENHEVRKGLWAFFLDCTLRMLIGWAGKLRSRGCRDTQMLVYDWKALHINQYVVILVWMWRRKRLVSVRSIKRSTCHSIASSCVGCIERLVGLCCG